MFMFSLHNNYLTMFLFLHFYPHKGLVHTTGGYALYAMHTTATTFGLSQQSGPSNPDAPHKDVYACVADAGWITGHTYIVSDHLLCCIMHTTTVILSPLFGETNNLC